MNFWISTQSIRHTVFRHAVMSMLAVSACSILVCDNAIAQNSQDAIKTLRALTTGDQSTLAATQAISQLRGAKDVTLTSTLTAMKGATPLGRNWLLGLANSIYRKTGSNQTSELTQFLADQSQDGEARYTVFQWMTSNNAELRKSMLAKMKEDSSPELRFMAIDEAVKEKLEVPQLVSLLDSARHPSQVISIVEKLKELGETIDQSAQLGFIAYWRLIGPFDNVGSASFDNVFPIEADLINGTPKQEYQGKTETVTWKEEITSAPDGTVNLAKIYSNEKGCVIYALHEFESDQDRDAEVRLGCINGNKVWVNGKLAISNEVYHTGAQIDQYSEPIRLKAGKNQIVLKIYQNEQKEQWAQDYQFQLRICDNTGKAILTKGR